MDSFLHDLRYGIRMLVKAPGFTAIAVLTLALGIGANTVVFSIVNAVLLRPLPYQQPQQLVKVWGQYTNEGIPQNWISEPEWWDMQSGLHAFSALAAYTAGSGANLSLSGSEPTRITRNSSTSSLFPLLGVKPLLGRTFSPDEDKPGKEHAVLLSYKCWTAKLASDPNIVGRSLDLNLEKYTVVGVLPKDFAFAGDADVWVPLGLDRAKPEDRGAHYLEVIGRMAPGVTSAQADSDLRAFAAAEARQYPDNYRSDSGWGMFARPLRTELVGDIRTATLVIFGAVGFVLLIACANVANLLLARASARTREMAMRAALGAGRWRLIRQLLTESVLIGCIGGGLGVAIAIWGTVLMSKFAVDVLPEGITATVDVSVLAFAAAISIGTGMLFGLVPALQSSRPGLFDTLKTARSSPAASTHRTRNGLVVAEISVALVLLVAAGLMVRSLQRLINVNPGFAAERVLTARVFLPEVKYKEGVPLASFFREYVGRLRNLPGVEAAGAINLLPVTTSGGSGSTYIEDTRTQGLPVERWAKKPYIEADRRYTTPLYFETMKLPLLRGRYFTDADDENAPLVAIVDDTFAKRFWPNEDPIGRRIATGAIANTNPPVPQWRTIVGVVGHVKNGSLDKNGREQTYFPQSQVSYIRSMSVVVRTTAVPAAMASALRTQLAALDPSLPLYQVQTMDDTLEHSTSQRRFNMSLLVGFGLVALTLAAIGTYGVLSYSVGQRTSEIGIRMALGAGRGEILSLIVGDGIRLAGLGVAMGFAAALVATRFMSTMLFGVGAIDPLSFGIAAVVLVGMALLAAYAPARRATRVDPIIALRNE